MQKFTTIILSTLLTLCLSIQADAQTVLQEGFEAPAFPSTWMAGILSPSWTRINAPTSTPAQLGTGVAAFNASLGIGTNILTSPAFSFAALPAGNNQISFWMYRDNGNPNLSDKLDIFLSTTNTLVGAVPLGTYFRHRNLAPVETSVGWFRYTIPVPAAFDAATSCYLLIQGTSLGGSNILIDNITANHCAASLSANISDVSCFGGNNGSIDLTVNNAAAPYSFNWSSDPSNLYTYAASSEDASGLNKGTYTVNVTDAVGCEASGTYTVSQPASQLNPSVNTNQVNCFTQLGSLVTTTSGGTAPYTYSWSGANNFIATTQDITAPKGNYTLVVTDAKGCTAGGSFTIEDAIVVNGTLTHINCNGASTGAVNLILIGGGPSYTYNWTSPTNPGFTSTTKDISNVPAGTYSVSVSDQIGCTGAYSLTLIEPTAVNINGAVTNAICNGGNTGAISTTVTGGTPGYIYSWTNAATTNNISGLTAGAYTLTVTDAKQCLKSATFNVGEPAAVTGTTTVSNVLCFGGSTGSVSLTPAGGTAPYTYLWNTGATTQNLTNKPVGTYTVTIKDSKNCIGTASATVTQPAVLATSFSQSDVSCHNGTDGSATVNVTGGTAPYSYSWNNGGNTQTVTGLSDGGYSVTVSDALGCTKNGSVNISEPSAISTNTSVINVSCNGGSNGSVNLTVSGGTAPYSFSWNNGATTEDISGVTAGTYTATITDAKGCTKTATATVGQPNLLSVSGTVSNVLCNSATTGSINLTVSGGNGGNNFSWSNGSTNKDINNLAANSYSVTVTDSKGCTASAGFTVTQPSAITLSAATTDLICNGVNTGSIAVTTAGGVSPYTYNWSNNATTSTINNLAANAYTVTVKDANNCSKTGTYTISQPVAIALTGSVTPPTCNNGTNGSISLAVANAVGTVSYNWNNGLATTSGLSGISAGTYSVLVTDGNSCTKSASYIVNNPAAITLTTTTTNNICNGGSSGAINLAVANGTAPYSYNWSNNATTQNISGLIAGTYSVTVTDFNGCTKSTAATINQPSIITISGSVTNVLCNGASTGAINLTASGGTGNLYYSWSNGATTKDINGLVAGTYTVTVTDVKGCAKTAAFTVSQPVAISLTATTANLICNGINTGSVDVVATGGTGSYTYLWNNAATTSLISNLAAGTYSVTVKDGNNCSKTGSYTVTQPLAITLAGAVTPPSCNGGTDGSLALSVTNGTSPYAFNWNTGATTQDLSAVSAGAYSVAVTDAAGCTKSGSFSIAQPAAITATATAAAVTCNGGTNGSIALSVANGTSPYSFSWSNTATTQNLTGLTAGNYSVVITDAKGCTKTATATIAQPTAITVSGVTTNILCSGANNGTITLTTAGGTGNLSFSWSNGSTSKNLTNLAAGTYTVTVKDANNCTQPASFTITAPSAINIAAIESDVTCNGMNNGDIDLNVTGGVAPYTYLWNNGSTIEDRSLLAPGNYSVTVKDVNNCTKTASYTITQPNVLVITSTSINPSCNGDNNGSVDVSVSGGTTPYSYSWENFANTQDRTGLSAGTYTLNVSDANGCDTVHFKVISEPAPLLITATKKNATCSSCTNGSITASATGGTSPYTYSWSTGGSGATKNNIAPGTYTVTVTDAKGCSDIMAVTLGVSTANTSSNTVIQTAPLSGVLTVNPVRTVTPGGDDYTIYTTYGPQTVTLTAAVSGGKPPYTYVWTKTGSTTSIGVNAMLSISPTTTTSTSITYTVTVKDANNTTIQLAQPITVINVMDGTKIRVCHNGTNSSYNTHAVHAHLKHGDNLGLCPNTNIRSIETGHDDHDHAATEEMIHVYPNPNSGMFTIEVPANGKNIEIFIVDINGKMIDRRSLKENLEAKQSYNFNSLPRGLYMVQVISSDKIYREKVMIQ
jgi:hypothetical protein